MDEMQLVAAGFPHESQATAAADELYRTLDLGPDDTSIHAVGGSEEFVDGSKSVLAGRIRTSRLAFVHEVLRRHGGEILTEYPERLWTGQP